MNVRKRYAKIAVVSTVLSLLVQMVPMGVVYAATDGVYIVGGGSGGGGGGSEGSSGAGGSGGNGGSSDLTITGTAGDDIIFGDGSGGGAGCRSVSYDIINTRGGFGGSGNDTITGGAGDDVIFGDGFNGQNSTGWGGGKGGLGGGGGGATGGHFGMAPNAGWGGIGGGGGGGGANTDNATYGLGGSTIVSGIGGNGGNGGAAGGNSTTTVGGITGLGGTPGSYSGGGGGGFGGTAGGAGGTPGAAGQDGDTNEHRYNDVGHAIRNYFSEAALRSVLTNYPNFGAGNDVIDGGSGSNELFGLGGNNTFIVNSDDSATGNRIWDFKAGDKLLLQTSGITIASVDVDTVLTGAAVGDYDADGNSDDTRLTFLGIPIDLIDVDFALDNISGQIMSPNASPVVTLDNGTLGYNVNNPAVQIDSMGAVNDSDGDSNWNNGSLAIRITGNANTSDTLSISDTNGSAPLITVVPSTTILRADGVNVGTLSHSDGTVTGDTTLTVTFESNATNAIVQEVMRSLRFSTSALGSGSRTITITAKDFAASSGQDTRTIAVPEPTVGGGSSANNDVDILINGKAESAGTVSSTTRNGQSVTTIIVDPQKLEQKLEREGNNAIVTIPVNTNSDIAVGALNGQMVKSMEDRQAVVEIKTMASTYKVPAQQINIDAISKQLGTNVQLSDITVEIEIAKAGKDTVKVVEDSALKGNFTLIAPPLDYNITCDYNNKTVNVSLFNAYVTRTIAMPDGVDPAKITTGVVVESDGTVRHEPTQITVIDGKYYAKINSLTNSTYALVWHPLDFKDTQNHWAKEATNDMGSRMIIEGVGNDMFKPNGDITRGEFAAVIVKALGLKPELGNNLFNDVKDSEWYSAYIKTAAEYGIMQGHSNGKFNPMDKITREQAMTVIARAMKITGLKADLRDSDIKELLAKFNDENEPSDYAKSSIAACIKTGIMIGRNKNMITPKDSITRAEAASIVRRLLQKSQLV